MGLLDIPACPVDPVNVLVPPLILEILGTSWDVPGMLPAKYQ